MVIERLKAHNGSMMVLVLCVMTAVLTFSTLLVRSGTQALDLALQRVCHAQRSRALADLCAYADGIMKLYLPTLSRLAPGSCIVHALPVWPLGMDTLYSGTITLEIQAKMVKVTSTLVCGDMVQETIKAYTWV